MKIKVEKDRYDRAQIGEHLIKVLSGETLINRTEYNEMEKFI